MLLSCSLSILQGVLEDIGIPLHTAYNISQYQHLYTANAKSVEIKPISYTVIEKGAFIGGKVAYLGVPKVDWVGGDSQYGYADSFHKYCIMTVTVLDSENPGKTIEFPAGILFWYPEPANQDISEGDLIVIKISSQVPHRESIMFRADFVRNLSQDWKTYKLPLTQ